VPPSSAAAEVRGAEDFEFNSVPSWFWVFAAPGDGRTPARAHVILSNHLRGWHASAVGITPQQFKSLQSRLAAPRRPVEVSAGGASVSPVRAEGVLLGVDPSLRGTGFGVVRFQRSQAELLAHGTIACPAGWERSRCLAKISLSLREVIKAQKPEICIIESLFYAQNLQTALIMGEARGAALSVIAEAGLKIYEIAPRKVKQAIVGYGAAQKEAVAKMVQRFLNLAAPPAPDAADALALVLAFSQEHGKYSLKPPKKV
jgi:crossover junction endodeoxyribonuclease RuvC